MQTQGSPFLKVAEAARVLRISSSTVKHLIAEGRLRAVNVGKPGRRPQWRIDPDQLSQIAPPQPPRISVCNLGEFEVDI